MMNRKKVMRERVGLLMLMVMVLGSLPVYAQRVTEIRVRYDDGAEQVFAAADTPPAETAKTSPAQFPIAVVSAPAGMTTFVDGRSAVPEDQRTQYRWTWNFGDADSPYNIVRGFNAAHIYEKPGTYRITLTLQSGDVSRVIPLSVTIPPGTRRMVQVPDGTNLALYANANNLELELVKDGHYTVSGSTLLTGLLIRGNSATITAPDGSTMFSLRNTRVSDCIIDYPGAANPVDTGNNKGGVAFYPLENATVDGCVFLNVDFIINGNRSPRNVLVQGNKAPLVNGVKSGIWVQGGPWCFYGNSGVNQYVGWGLRAEHDAGPLAIINNDWTEKGAGESGVKGDQTKGCIQINCAHDVYVTGNTVRAKAIGPHGDIGIGSQVSNQPTDRTMRVVVEDNTLVGSNLGVNPGCVDVVVRDNAFMVDDKVTWKLTWAIVVNGPQTKPVAPVSNIRISGNTVTGYKDRILVQGGEVDGLEVTWGDRP